MKYENGFYIYIPNTDNELSSLVLPWIVPQVIQIIEDIIWLTGMDGDYTIDDAISHGCIGKMVLTEDGEEPK